MARNNNLTDFLKDVADAIREKTNASGLVNPQDFPERIGAIETTGGQPEGTHTVRFIDVDGTILKTQYVADGGSATVPANPSREKCEFVKWSDPYTNITRDTDVFPLYKSADGNSWYRVKAAAGDLVSLSVYLESSSSPLTADWGDGATGSVTGWGRYIELSHVYADAFDGWVKVSSEVGHRLSTYTEGNPAVTEIIVGDNVSALASVARGMANLKAIVIPETVTQFNGRMFRSCTSLSALVFPDGVTTITTDQSSLATRLRHVRLPGTLTAMPQNLLAYCTSLQSVVIPSGVTSIGNNAFQNCTSLQSVVIPSGVTSIGTYAFQYCTSLQSVVIPSGVTSIGTYAFQYCTSLQSVVIPSGVTSIGTYAFQYCTSLQSVVIPSGVTSIGNNAFQNCTSLQSVVIPSGVTSIGTYAFQNCMNATFTADLSDTPPANGYFSGCERLTGAITLNSTADLGNDAFNKSGISSIYAMSARTVHTSGAAPLEACPNLVRAELPNVTELGRTTLYNNPKLAVVVLGENLTSIGNMTMALCPVLSKVVVKATVPPTVSSDAFKQTTIQTGLYVPDASVEVYKTATNWSAFADIIKPLSEFVE